MCQPETSLRVFLAGGSIFAAIQSVEDFPFFATNAPDDLDRMLVLNYGQRIMFNPFNEEKLDSLAKYIVKTNGNKWSKLIEFANANINLGADSSKVIKGNEKQTETKVDDTTTTNKVSAFNSDDLINDTGSTIQGDETTESTITRDSTEDKISYKYAFDNLSLADKTNIITTVLKDVATYLTISIY